MAKSRAEYERDQRELAEKFPDGCTSWWGEALGGKPWPLRRKYRANPCVKQCSRKTGGNGGGVGRRARRRLRGPR